MVKSLIFFVRITIWQDEILEAKRASVKVLNTHFGKLQLFYLLYFLIYLLCCGSLGLWLYLIKRQNKKCVKAKMINYHCFKIKLNHYLSAGPPLSIVPDDDISFPFRRNIPEIHNITNQLNDFSAKNKVLISDLVTKFWIKNRHDSVLN